MSSRYRGLQPLPLTCVLGLSCAIAHALEPVPVSFRAPDGLRIAADYYPPPTANRDPAPMVILLHQLDGDSADWEPLLLPLHEAGFAVLAPDLRGHGDSATTDTSADLKRRSTQLFRDMQADLRGAYDWLAEQSRVDRSRFAIVGAGLGASLALEYAAKDRSIDALICISPGRDDVGLDDGGAMHQITGRDVLLVVVPADRDAAYSLQKRGERVDVELIADCDERGTDLLTAAPKLPAQLAQRLDRAVGEPTATTVYGTINSNVYHLPDSGWIERISPSNLRYYSSPQEAERRGLRASKSKGPSRPRTRDRSSRR
jgi:pimeloyl-ACP methyl ester carboxylesterase